MNFINEIIDLTNAMAIYLLFGLFIAGILHELIPEDLIKKHLGKNSISSVIKATIFGLPLPVCSCGVIPLATSLKKSGASSGSVLSFLISTPITGIDSILATFGMFGWIFTIYRVVTSIIIAITAGILVNLLDKPKFSIKQPSSFSTIKKEDCIGGNCKCKEKANKRFSLKSALKYGFITLFGDIAKPLFWGLVIGAVISIATPDDLSDLLNRYSFLSYIIVILIAVPMYVCATSSLPIAAALMLNGVSAGAAFVFLSAGPATNTVTIAVVKNMLGKKALFIYLFAIIFGSTLFGLGLDLIFKGMDVKNLVHIDENAGFFTIFFSIIFWLLLFYHLFKHLITKKERCPN